MDNLAVYHAAYYEAFRLERRAAYCLSVIPVISLAQYPIGRYFCADYERKYHPISSCFCIWTLA